MGKIAEIGGATVTRTFPAAGENKKIWLDCSVCGIKKKKKKREGERGYLSVCRLTGIDHLRKLQRNAMRECR
jgi:hypothetical protein